MTHGAMRGEEQQPQRVTEREGRTFEAVTLRRHDVG